MQKPPDKLDIAHLGFNFWKKIVEQNPSPYSKNRLLLCLDEEGKIIRRLLLPCSWRQVREHAARAQLLGASTLVRMQESVDPPDIDPFEINSPFTKSLYRTAKIYGLRLAEVIRPCSHSNTYH
jgi:hypothetical protein